MGQTLSRSVNSTTPRFWTKSAPVCPAMSNAALVRSNADTTSTKSSSAAAGSTLRARVRVSVAGCGVVGRWDNDLMGMVGMVMG